ncbi:hypothetical protein LPJ61_006363 [Coemansia biformis]|uniref:Uncharacterized protein n=1 Tax=Coemansia biformis TaxID=1286918 RepID=A0A9W8CP54_9FUNG|nr:hypothetical protein LPJ61_006363 [Coemansia biformis]
MKIASIAAAIALVASVAVAGLSDKVKGALTTFMARSHPSPHTEKDLIAELSEYSANAGLSDVSGSFGQKKYAQAAMGLDSHAHSISGDPMVQHGGPLAEPFMMLNDCVSELHTIYK